MEKMCKKVKHVEKSVSHKGNLSRPSQLITKFSCHDQLIVWCYKLDHII